MKRNSSVQPVVLLLAPIQPFSRFTLLGARFLSELLSVSAQFLSFLTSGCFVSASKTLAWARPFRFVGEGPTYAQFRQLLGAVWSWSCGYPTFYSSMMIA